MCVCVCVFYPHMLVNACIYSFIWPYIPIHAPFWSQRGAQDLFPVHSHPGSWCPLYQAAKAMVQCHLTSTQKFVVLAQLPGHADKQLSKVLYK